MWPFRHKTQAPAAGGPQPVPTPVIRHDWAALPPIQRTFGDHPLTAPSDRFSDDLATHHDPSVTSDQMGHQVSAEAPAGIVLTLARTSTRSDGPAMIPRPPVQRRVDGAVAQSGEWDGDEAAADEPRPTPVPAAIQRTAVVERPVVEPAPELPPLTALPADAQPVPVVSRPQRSMTAPLVATTVSRLEESHDLAPATPSRLTLGQARRLGLGAPIRKVPDRTVQRARDEPTTATESSTQPTTPDFASVPAIPSVTPAPASPSTGVQRDAAAPLSPVAAPSAPVGSVDQPRLDLPLAPVGRKDEPISEPAASPVEPQTTSTSSPSVQASAESMAPPVPLPTPAAPATAPRVIQRTMAPDSPNVSGSNVQTTDTDPAMASVNPATFAVTPLPLRPAPIARAASTANAGPAGSSGADGADAPLIGARPMATLQRSTDDWSASIDRPISRSFAADLRSPSIARVHEPGLTDEPSAAQPSGSDDDLVPLSSPAPLQRASTGLMTPSLSRPPMGRAISSLAPRRSEPGWTSPTPIMPDKAREVDANLPLAPVAVAIQRASVEVASEPPAAPAESDETTIQRGWFDSISSSVGSMGTPSSSQVASAAGTIGSGISSLLHSTGSKTTEGDMDELAAKLYDKIRARLKTELLVDRERAGFLTDLR